MYGETPEKRGEWWFSRGAWGGDSAITSDIPSSNLGFGVGITTRLPQAIRKEQAPRHIRFRRTSKNLIAVDVFAVSSDLLSSQLFRAGTASRRKQQN
ncbi:hypothetical protein AY498_09730 [Corynebacterium ulcerans]|nr:hypothetical protein AY498_09730 [Corynebacterium ulcerans]